MKNDSVPACLEREYPILINQIGADCLLRPSLVFDFLQDIAARHAELLGVGMSHLQELGIIWVLSRIRLRIEQTTGVDDSILVRTWPRGIHKLFATRQFELFSVRTGKRLGYASSYWLMLNNKTMRPINPAEIVEKRLPHNEDKPVFFDELAKLPVPGDLADPVPCTAAQSHIDCNRHMNNAFYPLLIQDWLARKKQAYIQWEELQINFNHAVKFGESFQCTGKIEGDGAFTVQGLLPDGRNVFTSSGRLSAV